MIFFVFLFIFLIEVFKRKTWWKRWLLRTQILNLTKIFLSAKILVNLHDLQSLAKLVNMFFNSFGVCVVCACVYVSHARAQWSSGVLFSLFLIPLFMFSS